MKSSLRYSLAVTMIVGGLGLAAPAQAQQNNMSFFVTSAGPAEASLRLVHAG